MRGPVLLLDQRLRLGVPNLPKLFTRPPATARARAARGRAELGPQAGDCKGGCSSSTPTTRPAIRRTANGRRPSRSTPCGRPAWSRYSVRSKVPVRWIAPEGRATAQRETRQKCQANQQATAPLAQRGGEGRSPLGGGNLRQGLLALQGTHER